MTSKATKSVEHHSLATPETTAPPRPKHSTPTVPSRYRVLELLRRQQSCSYGKCGNDCLPQGSFCCNPAGAAFDVPRWVCDNGQCITSVRGTTGVVDCYDPDNPSGTTQSCVDNVATTSCHSGDRCYTCASEIPFCHWETYIASGSPTLSWFYCLPARATNGVFYAATITGNGTVTSSPAVTPTTGVPKSTSSTSVPVAPPVTSTTKSLLGTGAIAGIAAGGGVAFFILLAICIYCIRRWRKKRTEVSELPPVRRFRTPMELRSQELDSQSKFHTTASIVPTSTSIISPQSQGSYEYPPNPHPVPEEYYRQGTPRSPPPAELSDHHRSWEESLSGRG